jgi:hypothetical protein
MAEKTYQLKDPNTSFYDDQSGLEVTRDQKVSIGEGAGKKTLQMIAKGGLVEAKGEAAPPSGFNPDSGKDDKDDLSDDFPHREKLIAGGFKTRSSLKALSDDELQGVKGIGPASVEAIRDALK